MRTLRLILAALVATAMFATTTPVFADYLPGQDNAEQVDGLEMMVKYLATEQFVPSRLEFRKLSADPVSDLVTVASKSKYAAAMRARAISSLALYVEDDRAVQTIDEMMTRVSPGGKLFAPTLLSYAAVHGEAVTAAVSPYAEHPNSNVRMVAVIALGRYCGQAGADTLKSFIDSEEDEVVLNRIHTYVN